MKKLLISSCEDCPYLAIYSGRFIQCEKDDLEIYKCSNLEVVFDSPNVIYFAKSKGKGKAKIGYMYREIGRSDEIPENDSIMIPKWCPLEDDVHIPESLKTSYSDIL